MHGPRHERGDTSGTPHRRIRYYIRSNGRGTSWPRGWKAGFLPYCQNKYPVVRDLPSRACLAHTTSCILAISDIAWPLHLSKHIRHPADPRCAPHPPSRRSRSKSKRLSRQRQGNRARRFSKTPSAGDGRCFRSMRHRGVEVESTVTGLPARDPPRRSLRAGVEKGTAPARVQLRGDVPSPRHATTWSQEARPSTGHCQRPRRRCRRRRCPWPVRTRSCPAPAAPHRRLDAFAQRARVAPRRPVVPPSLRGTAGASRGFASAPVLGSRPVRARSRPGAPRRVQLLAVGPSLRRPDARARRRPAILLHPERRECLPCPQRPRTPPSSNPSSANPSTSTTMA